jgi:glycosyltransferase involved in cell wall biosynthesis
MSTEPVKVPKLSIGVPVLNGERWMRRSIESALSQSFTDFELIFSDNASDDATAAICREYAAADPRIRYIRQPSRLSAVDNFRFVLSEARGQYFIWLATDDWWRDGFLERATTILDRDPGVVMVFSYFQEYDWTTGQLRPLVYPVASHGAPRLRLLTRILHPVANAIYGVIRREAIDLGTMLPIDFFDLLFLNDLAVKGDMAVLSDDLFVAGWKPFHDARRIRVGPYFRQMWRLIRRNFRGTDRLFLSLFLVRQVALFYRQYRGRGR